MNFHCSCCAWILTICILLQVNSFVSAFSSITINQKHQTHRRNIINMSAAAKTVLNHIGPDKVAIEIKDPVDPQALEQAKAILEELKVGAGGVVSSAKLVDVAKRLGDIPQDATNYVVSPEQCKAAFDGLSEDQRTALVNIHARVKAFAEAQRATVKDMEMDIPGGKAGHTVSPCKGKTFFFI